MTKMMNGLIVTTTIAILTAASARGATARVAGIHIQPLATPDAAEGNATAGRRFEPASESTSAPVPNASGPALFSLYPVAGTIGKDVAIPYYVDLDPGSGIRDFGCGDRTFDTHTGHDPYIRSFAEQSIGVPVFAVADGEVIDLHDGEPDQNVHNEPAAIANYITLRHDNGRDTQYVHLRSGSVTLHRGDFVTAGTQIGLVGSSGVSVGPHIHFEVRENGHPVEPVAGPCRAGLSYFAGFDDVPDVPVLTGATFSTRSFGEFAAAPFDDAPHTGTFRRGLQTIYFKADLANVGANTQYTLELDPPGGSGIVPAASGKLISWNAAVVSIWWELQVDLDLTGRWNLKVDIDNHSYTFPFDVVTATTQVVNRAPNSISASLEPVGLHANQVPVCRVLRDAIADPDYDVVRYRYEWRLDGQLVRDVTTAAMSDALGRQFVQAGHALSCTVTPSDGTAAAQPVTANASPEGWPRRRAVR